MKLKELNEINYLQATAIGAGVGGISYGLKKIYDKYHNKSNEEIETSKLKDITPKDIDKYNISTTHIETSTDDNKNNESISSLTSIENIEVKDLKKSSFILKCIKNTFSSFLNTMEIALGINIKNLYVQKDENISNKLTNMFQNTKIYVYRYESAILNAYTIPGILDPISSVTLSTAHNFINVSNNIMNTFEIQNPLINSMFYHCINYMNLYENTYVPGSGIYALYKNKVLHKLEYNPSLKKFNIGLPAITIYYSSKYNEININEEELIAILLHEIGHNTMIFSKIIDKLIKNYAIKNRFLVMILEKITPGDPISFMNTLLNFIQGNDKWGNSIQKSSNYSNTQMVLFYCLFFIIFSFVINYLSRRQEVYSDEFAIKCGYGEQLASAFEKTHKYHTTLQFNNKKMNIIDKINHLLSMITYYIIEKVAKFKLTDHPDTESRIKSIREKTKQYDTLDKNTDRSEHIQKITL